jgi:Leucine-rich repeat (LRR) protein
LPEEVGFFENLRVLRLTNCDLKSLPTSIGQLTKLTELHLGGNALNTLPDSILNCSKLFAIRGLYHQLPYSKLIQCANAFFEKENIAVAVNLIQQAFQAGTEQSDLFSSNYSEAIALLKKIVNGPHLEAQDYRDLSFHVIEAIDKISDKSEKFSAFRAILQEVGSSQKNFDENPELAQQILNFQNRLTASCVELTAALPESSSPYMALRQLTETLFSINSFSEGLKVAQQLIDFSNSRPNYNRWTMIVDMKGSELESTSNMLRELSMGIFQKDKELAFKVANLIPLANIRSVALSDLG